MPQSHRSTSGWLAGAFVATSFLPIPARAGETDTTPERIAIATEEPETIDAWPSIARLEDGRLLCVFSRPPRAGAKPTAVVGCFSNDHGQTWSDPVVLLADEQTNHYDPSLVVIGPRVIVSSTAVPRDNGERISTSHTIAVTSEDNGHHWSNPYEIPMGRRYTSGKINNGVVLPDGSVLLGFTWESNLETVESLSSEGQMEEVSAAMVSFDDGRTWTAGQGVGLEKRRAGDRPNAINGMCEPALVPCGDGSVYMLCRTGLERLYECRSRDGGRTWSRPQPSLLVGHNAPAALCVFESSRGRGVLAVWNNSPRDRWPLSVAASFDDCHTWSKPQIIAEDQGYESSYPGCTQAADGTLVVVYQQMLADGGRRIIVTRFDPDWLDTASLVNDAAPVQTPHPNVCTTPTPRTETAWVERHEQINQRVSQGPVNLVFIGDSITHRWDSTGIETWDEYYAGRNAANLGIDGDGTQTVLWRLDHGNIDGIAPKVAIVMIGTNNSTDPNQTPQMIAQGIEAIVTKLREALPMTKVLLLSIFPRGQSITFERRNGAEASAIASRIADDDMIFYLDIGDAFVNPDDTISPDVMPDYLHLSAKGYHRWAQAMEPTLRKLLDEDTPP